jgi:hypothetical protein
MNNISLSTQCSIYCIRQAESSAGFCKVLWGTITIIKSIPLIPFAFIETCINGSLFILTNGSCFWKERTTSSFEILIGLGGLLDFLHKPHMKKYDHEYSVEFAITEVAKLSKSLQKRGMKLCLLIGRTPGEPFPGFEQKKEDHEVWVSLDSWVKPFVSCKQLHLVMNMNDDQMKKIHKLFDKVLVDYSTLKFHQGKDQKWRLLGQLLRPQKQSQLITEIEPGMVYVDGILMLMPEEMRKLSVPQLRSTPEYQAARKKYVEDDVQKSLDGLKESGCFSSIVLEKETPFPFMYRTHRSAILPHVILSGPQEEN